MVRTKLQYGNCLNKIKPDIFEDSLLLKKCIHIEKRYKELLRITTLNKVQN